MPVSVSGVPADVAAGRVPAADVRREKLILQAQDAKKASEEALRRGHHDAARSILDGTIRALAAEPEQLRDATFASELQWLTTTRDGLADWDTGYTSKRMRSDRMRKSRGFRTREQGGEVPVEDSDGEASAM